MTYEIAEKLIHENFGLINQFGQTKTFPFYIKDLIIIPKDEDLETQMKIYKSYIVNGYDNKKAIEELGYSNKPLDVLILGTDGGFFPTFLLNDYLEELKKQL